MASNTHVASLLVPAPTAPSADVSPRRRATGFRPRVLLAEPQAEAREALARELVGAGFEVFAAPGVELLLGEQQVDATEGDERGFMPVRLFQKVEDAKGQPLPGWSEEECAQRAKEAEAQSK